VSDRLFTILYATLLFIVMSAGAVDAQDKTIAYVVEGDTAPYTGVLLTPAAFAELKVKADITDIEIALKVDFEVASAILDKQLEIDNLNTKLSWQGTMWEDRLGLKNSQIDSLYDQLEKSKKRTIWQKMNGPLHFAAGLGLSIGVFYVHSKLVTYTLQGK